MERQSLPTYGQWMRFKEGLRVGIVPYTLGGDENLQTWCIHCQLPVEVSESGKVTIGAVVKRYVEEDVEISGTMYPELVVKVLPVFMKGDGCPDCQALITKIQSEELYRQDEFMPEVRTMTYTLPRVKWDGRLYEWRDGKWYDLTTHISVPAYLWATLIKQPVAVEELVKESKVLQVGKGLTKRTPFIDVSSEVMAVPKLNQDEKDELDRKREGRKLWS